MILGTLLAVYAFGMVPVAILSKRWEDCLLWPFIVGVAIFKRAREILK